MRLGLGVMFMLHGLPKFTGGPEKWASIGSKMSLVGIDFLPEFWGFMVAFAEFGGGFLLILGFMFRPALAMLTFTMVIAAIYHIDAGDSFGSTSHSIEAAIVFLALMFIGPGRYSLDER